MAEAIQKLIDAKLHYVFSIAMAIFVIAGAFYSLTARVSVQEEKIAALSVQLRDTSLAAEKYQELARSIDSRLSNIEGRLDVRN
jgi:uncharacterized coiled-coil protein SlyX